MAIYRPIWAHHAIPRTWISKDTLFNYRIFHQSTSSGLTQIPRINKIYNFLTLLEFLSTLWPYIDQSEHTTRFLVSWISKDTLFNYRIFQQSTSSGLTQIPRINKIYNFLTLLEFLKHFMDLYRPIWAHHAIPRTWISKDTLFNYRIFQQSTSSGLTQIPRINKIYNLLTLLEFFEHFMAIYRPIWAQHDDSSYMN